VRKQRLAHTRQVFDEQVAAREEAAQRELDLPLFTEQYGVERFDERFYFRGNVRRGYVVR
jgi:hypothetical protein